jgi:hypothetical protein
MLNKSINIIFDILALFILWLLAPVLITLFSPVAPAYATIIGVLFIALIMAAVVYQSTMHKFSIPQH